MTCREQLECLIDYVAGALAPERRRDCEQHLGRCSHCRNYVDQYRTTIVTIRACDSTPADLPEWLVQSFLSHRVTADVARHRSRDEWIVNHNRPTRA